MQVSGLGPHRAQGGSRRQRRPVEPSLPSSDDSSAYNNNSTCIGDDTKAVVRRSPKCIRKTKNKIRRRTIFNVALDHDIEFARRQHPAVWHVALGWRAIEFAQTSAILEFYIWFRFRPYHRSRHVILHQSAKFYPNRTSLGRKKWRYVNSQDGWSKPSWILGVQ